LWYLSINPGLCVCLFLFLFFFFFFSTLHSREPHQHLHAGSERGHGARVLHRHRQHVAEVGVEVLLIAGRQAQAREPSAPGVALGLLHQGPAVALPSLRVRHHHRLHKQAAAATHDPGQPGVAEQPLRLSVAPQENQADGEFRTGLLEGVDPGGPAPLPLAVHQVCAGSQQVRTPVDRHRADLLWSLRDGELLNFSIRRRKLTRFLDTAV